MQDVIPCSLLHPSPTSLWQTHVALEVDDLDDRFRILLPHVGEHVHRAILRAVVDEDELHAPESLREERACATFDVVLHTIDRHNDRHLRRRDSFTVHFNSFVHSK